MSRQAETEGRRGVRQVISGEAYDTETASCLHRWESEHGPVGEALYQNLHDRYFLYSWNEDFVGEPEGWERLRPLTTQQAIDWAERMCFWLVEELFGRMPEAGAGEPYKTLD